MEVKQVAGYKTGSVYFACESNRGFFYRRKTYGKNGEMYLVCVEKDCTARAKCNETVFLKFDDDDLHNHLPDVAKMNALELKNSMISQAVTTSNQVRSIFVESGARANVEAASKLTFARISQTMRRERRKVQPGIPSSLEELGNVSENNVRFGTVDEKPFCRGVVGTGEFASALFLAEDLIQLLSDAKEIHIDGTFKTRPKTPKSSQLLTILVIKYGYAFPCAFALMPNRRMPAYNALFSALKERIPSFDPQLIMTDYEVALIQSLNQQFPNAHKTGCYFHYCQAVIRHAGNLGMIRLIKDNSAARKALRLLLSLPLLPAANFVEGLQHINSFLRQRQLLSEFEMLMGYHERQWMRRVGPESVSVFQRNRRTNNDAESFHASLQRQLKIRGPNVWEFVDGLRDITAITIRELSSFIEEGLPIRILGKRRYRGNETRIRNATELFVRNREVGPFLEQVSHGTDRLIHAGLGGTFEEEEDEEYILGTLTADVPTAFQSTDNSTPSEGEEEEEEQHNASGPLNVASDEERGGHTLCMICGQVPPTTLLRPCNHFGLCDDCSGEMQRRANQDQRPDEEWGYTINYSVCPMDRIPIEEFVTIYTT